MGMLRMMTGIAGWLAVAVLAGACSDRENIRDYYFPVLDLQEGRVYAYASETDTADREYWYLKSFVRDSGIFLVITHYDRHFTIDQIVREKIVDNGVLARDYFLYQPDTASGTLRQTAARLESANTFPFEVRDTNGIFLFSLRYHPPGDSATTIYLYRNRRYLGAAEPFVFGERSYPAIRMGMREVVGNEQEGAAEVEGSGEELYAKGLGLVAYRRSFGSGQYAYAYRLREIFSMEELVARGARQQAAPGGPNF